MPDVRLERLSELKPVRTLPGRNRTKADVHVYRIGDTEVAVKDYRARPFFIRNTLGRRLIRREAAAFRAAEGLPGLPRFLGRLGPFTLATEWLHATPLSALRGSRVEGSCFDRLETILRQLHARGIAHADLHHRDVLVDERGGVHVVDLASACLLRGAGIPGLRRAVFDRLRDQDLVALGRMRARFTGGDEDQAVRAVGARAAAWYRRGRRLKGWWDRLRGRRR